VLRYAGVTLNQVANKNVSDLLFDEKIDASELLCESLLNLPQYKKEKLTKTWKQRIDHVLENKEPMEFKDFNSNGTKDLYGESALSPIMDENGEIFAVCIIYRDITAKTELEKNLKEKVKELAERESLLNEFVYIASHDLQEPLRKIAAFGQILSQSIQDKIDDDNRKHLEYMVDGAIRIKKIIADLLEFAKTSNWHFIFKEIDLNICVQDAVHILEDKIKEKNVRVEISTMPIVLGDQTMLTSVFLNLISNAIKFSKKDSKPIVEILYEPIKEGHEITVKDNGIGIDLKHFKKIFEPFHKLHSPEIYPGSGIGLAICRKAIERHGGKILVESEPGVGTSFHVILNQIKGEI
jgi:light-regulated signal transduction histidine kinase (bacteriophytochrome)